MPDILLSQPEIDKSSVTNYELVRGHGALPCSVLSQEWLSTGGEYIGHTSSWLLYTCTLAARGQYTCLWRIVHWNAIR